MRRARPAGDMKDCRAPECWLTSVVLCQPGVPLTCRTMDRCCDAEELRASARRASQRKVRQGMLAVNAALFFLWSSERESGSARRRSSVTLDMLGDAFVYGFSLYVLERSERERTYAALAKGIIMAAFGLYMVCEAVAKKISSRTHAGPATVTNGADERRASQRRFSRRFDHVSSVLMRVGRDRCSRPSGTRPGMSGRLVWSQP